MSSPNRRRPRRDEEDEHPDERWMASYMDMVTVLMCMFIVLFAMSTVDQAKFEQLKASLATGFGQVETNTVDTAKGVVVPPAMVEAEEILDPDADLAMLAAMEVEDLTALRDRLQDGLEEKGMQDDVRFEIDERGLTIRLVSSEMFFEPDLAALTGEALDVLDVIGPVLQPTKYELSVEGHTAQVRQYTDSALDWELSTARSVNVLRYLMEPGGIDYSRIKAVGFGESRPLTAGTSAAELAQNRRVDIVVLSGQSEAVRQLMPAVVAGEIVFPEPDTDAAPEDKGDEEVLPASNH
ncbi:MULTISPECIES: OmpA/MotB family protein [Arthrobacter]|uniref:Flagellar motor protein MotB n=1 Tax=Arthrobacter caoxuetaonis TaxID=2886935 RepID=A0A9X1MDZ0_9MICC|nr:MULTISPECIES: flagellar motor protein MotB [Arthrobacter]MCC3283151.1 flagellar motor protein MotB [Arthrobacter caoxuetaonis]MCC3298269.1 flagellar motor protein MotB [Arthrobacter caoxuetaonis]MCC9195031.1 flagellar motor protein MotB [Arthrobacter sp. zg-Y916]USQ57713.1 flagellar motor protein MotB [Arthrobacter caoxuetaonis]